MGRLIFNRMATIGNGVEVRVSSKTGGGNGLFATKLIKKGQAITELHGRRFYRDEAMMLRAQGKDSHIRAVVTGFEYIDGDKEPVQGKGGASFANDGLGSALNNSRWESKYDSQLGRERVFLRATKDILAGCEVFVSYGRTYWHQHAALLSAVHHHQQQQQQQQPPPQPQQQQQQPVLAPRPKLCIDLTGGEDRNSIDLTGDEDRDVIDLTGADDEPPSLLSPTLPATSQAQTTYGQMKRRAAEACGEDDKAAKKKRLF